MTDDTLTPNIPEIVDEVRRVFERYEAALTVNNVEELDALFWDSPHTIRYSLRGNGYGYGEIQRHRREKSVGPGLKESELRVEILTFGKDMAIVNQEFATHGSDDIGRQSQTWVRMEAEGWQVVAAHVSMLAPDA